MNGILLQHGYLIAQIKADEDTRALLQNKKSITKENKEDLTVVANIEESLKQYLGIVNK
jgi:lipoate-protein ligase A